MYDGKKGCMHLQRIEECVLLVIIYVQQEWYIALSLQEGQTIAKKLGVDMVDHVQRVEEVIDRYLDGAPNSC